MRVSVLNWLRKEQGSSVVEFALCLAPFLLLLFGIIQLCLVTYSAEQLNYAAETTARCMVVAQASGYTSAPCYYNTSTSNTTAVQTYFLGHYGGTTAQPAFDQLDETVNCQGSTGTKTDYQVVAHANYVINAAFFTKTVQLTARACFPHA
jgi:Flp pilus assembly protein TadG